MEPPKKVQTHCHNWANLDTCITHTTSKLHAVVLVSFALPQNHDQCGTFYVGITSKGKGFQGVMKRHNFGGGRATHGSKFHRQNGGIGMSSTPSKILKGLKMAGRMELFLMCSSKYPGVTAEVFALEPSRKLL